MAREIDVHGLAVAQAAGEVVLDVRQPEEYVTGHVPGARLVPLDEVVGRVNELPRHGRVYVVCASGSRSSVAADWLSSVGFDAVTVAGGTTAWRRAGYPLVTGPREAAA